MSTSWLPILFISAYITLIFIPIGVVYFWRTKLLAKRRSPLTQMLLRSPGESLRNELDDTANELLLYFMLFPMTPLLIYAIHITQSYFGGASESFLRIGIIILSTIAASGYFLHKIITLQKRAHHLRLGYEGEMAIAQELNQLMHSGAHVFHDVPADGFNIDHVIIWSKGVYAVETKGRMKPKRDGGSEDAKMVFDGQRLQFPGWSETAPLDQTVRQAKWLAQWLSSAVGDKVEVKPVLALPGWYIERQAKSDVFIFNGKNASGVFSKFVHTTLSDEMIKRIAHQLEQRCRDVAPRHFHKRNKIAANA